jgi:transcriptional regulator with XRE-family HTH domain
MTLKEFVCACRDLAEMDQSEFAEAVGIGSQAISNIEKGTNLPSFKVLNGIAHAAGVELEDCMVFWDPRLKQSREQEDDDARGLLELVLRSPARDQIISFLRAFDSPVVKRTGKAPRFRHPSQRAGKRGRDDK